MVRSMFVLHLLRAAGLHCLTGVIFFIIGTGAFAQQPITRNGLDMSQAIYGTPDIKKLEGPVKFLGLTARSAGADVDPAFAPSMQIAYGFVNAIEQQPDGKVLVGGGFKSFNGYATACMVRLNADKSIDTTFRTTI